MTKWLYLSLTLVILQGCATSGALKTYGMAEQNVSNLGLVAVGMGEAQVICIMRDPYRGESFQIFDDQYDVLFYVTNFTLLAQSRMVPLNLTPLIFKNKTLVGMGYSYYRWLQEQAGSKKTALVPQPTAPIPTSAPAPKSEPLEKALKEATSFEPPAPVQEMTISMSSPKKTDKDSEEPPPAPPQDKKEPDIKINDKDNQMIEDESDQNFNFW